MAGKPRKTDAVPVVAAELPQSSSIPRNLGPVLLWVLGTAVAVTALWVAVITIREHTATADKEHDAKFASVETMKQHERDDISAIKGLTEAINNLAGSSNVTRQYLLLYNKRIESSVADLVSRQCRRDNMNAKDITLICDKELRAAASAAEDVKKQSDRANDVTADYQSQRIAPPAPTAQKEK